jgi:hypothetical protein
MSVKKIDIMLDVLKEIENHFSMKTDCAIAVYSKKVVIEINRFINKKEIDYIIQKIDKIMKIYDFVIYRTQKLKKDMKCINKQTKLEILL